MKKMISSVVALVLAAAIVVTVGVGSTWFTNWNVKTWFNSWGNTETEEESSGAGDETGDETGDESVNGGLVVSEAEESGITLLSAVLPVAAYAANGISDDAETAYILTATVGEDNNGANTGIDWIIDWEDGSSEWATGKTVTDYVTVTSAGDDYASSKVAYLENLQPFGETIIVTAVARANTDVTASFVLDYAQRLEGIALSFGDVECDFESGSTGVSVELNATGTPTGGAANFVATGSEVYTVAQTFTASYTLSLSSAKDYSAFLLADICGGVSSVGLAFGTYDPDSGVSASAAFSSYSVADSGLCFGLQYFADYMGLRECYSISSSGLWTDYDLYTKSASSIWVNVCDVLLGGGGSYSDGTFNHSCYGGNLFTLTVSVTGEYSACTYDTDFVMSGYTNLAAVTSVELDQDHIVI